MNADKLIKSEARQILSGKWGVAIACYFVTIFLYLIYSTISSVSYLLSNITFSDAIQSPVNNLYTIVIYTVFPFISFVILLLLTPVFSGITLISVKSTLNSNITFSDIIYFFDKAKYINSLKFWISLIFRYMTYIIGSFLFLFALNSLATSAESELLSNILFTIFVVSFVALFILFFYSFSSYFLAPYIHVSNINYSSSYCINLSIKIMKKNKKKFFSLLLSLIPWILLSLLIIPTIYTIPYIFTSLSVSAKYILTNNLKEF